MKRRLLFLLLSSFLFLNAVPAPKPALRPGKDRAVFFAIEKYQNGKLTNLQNPVKNARDIAGELKKRFGFETEVLENPTQEQIIGKLNELNRLYARNEDGQHPSDGQLFLFFSGHGMSEDENGYFLPADADPAKPYDKGIAYEIWRPKIDKINCRHILVAIDACYSVRFDPDWKNKPDGTFKRPGEMTDAQRALANYETYKARVFFTSDNKEDQTPDRSNFAHKLLEGLRTATVTDGFLTSKQLFANFVEGASPTPRAGTFGSDEPSSAFLLYGQNSMKTPVDTDGDGIFDDEDKCPTEKGEVIFNGCPKFDNMVLINGGTFLMGSENGEDDEKPIHNVMVNDFYLGRNEVTVAEFQAFIAETGYKTDAERNGGSRVLVKGEWINKPGRNWRLDSEGNNASDNYPVISVSWNDANEYCRWLSKKSDKNYRLPTEAEWEYAAGNGSRHTKYSWGNAEPVGKKGGSLADLAGATKFNWPKNATRIFLTYNDGFATNAPVGSFDPNELGLYDMSGNVWELCSDWYEADYYKISSSTNPFGPPSGFYKVARGGSWVDVPDLCRVANRHFCEPAISHTTVGFRLAMSK